MFFLMKILQVLILISNACPAKQANFFISIFYKANNTNKMSSLKSEMIFGGMDMYDCNFISTLRNSTKISLVLLGQFLYLRNRTNCLTIRDKRRSTIMNKLLFFSF